MQRRTFLELGTSLLSLPFFMGAKFNPHAQHKVNKGKTDKAVVFIMLSGGISHIDFTHGNPNLAANRRSANGEISTKTPGLYFGSDFTNLAGISNKLNVVHNYHHRNGNHQNAVYWQMSGYESNKLFQEAPAYGAYIAKLFGPSNAKNGLPVYLRTNRIDGDEGGWIGSAFKPFEASERGTADLTMTIPAERMSHRLRMLDVLETKMNREYNHASLDNMTKMRQQAVSMIAGDIKKVFDVNNEASAIRDAYGRTQPGDALLLSRRLIENGGKFINVNIDGWDMHQNIGTAMKARVPNFDKALTAFVNDLEQRGMLEDTLIVVTGDFGRTPVINKDAGRDHWPGLISLVFAGGQSEKGRIIGKASGLMDAPDDRGTEPHDVAKTIFDHFNVTNVQLTDIESRPRWIYHEASKNILTGV